MIEMIVLSKRIYEYKMRDILKQSNRSNDLEFFLRWWFKSEVDDDDKKFFNIYKISL